VRFLVVHCHCGATISAIVDLDDDDTHLTMREFEDLGLRVERVIDDYVDVESCRCERPAR
jgi:hypothetical protein